MSPKCARQYFSINLLSYHILENYRHNGESWEEKKHFNISPSLDFSSQCARIL